MIRYNLTPAQKALLEDIAHKTDELATDPPSPADQAVMDASAALRPWFADSDAGDDLSFSMAITRLSVALFAAGREDAAWQIYQNDPLSCHGTRRSYWRLWITDLAEAAARDRQTVRQVAEHAISLSDFKP